MGKISSTLSTNSKTIKRLYVTQFVMAIFSIMVLFACSQDTTLLLLASVLAIGIYMFLIYNLMWEAGAKVAAKHMTVSLSEENVKESVIVVLAGCVLNFIGAVTYLAIKIYLLAENITTNASDNIGVLVGNVVWLIIRAINAMYWGIEVLLFPNPNVGLPVGEATIEFAPLLTPPYYFFLIMIPMIATGICAYLLGVSEISIMEKLGFKKNK